MSNLYSQNGKLTKNSGKPTAMGYSFGMNVGNGIDSSLNQHVQSFNQHTHQNKSLLDRSLLGRKQYTKVHHNSPFGMTQDVINNSHNNPLANRNNSSHSHNSHQNTKSYQSFHPSNILSHTSKKTTRVNNSFEKKTDCQDSSAHCTRKNLSVQCSWMDPHDPPFCPYHKGGHKLKQPYQHSSTSERSHERRRSERSESNNSSRKGSGTGTEHSSKKELRRAERKRNLTKSKKKRRLQKQKADGRENRKG